MVDLPDLRRLEGELGERLGHAVVLAIAQRPLAPARLTPAERHAHARIVHAARAAEWLRGRAALREVVRRLGEAPGTGALRFPCATCSLTHAGGLAVAAGVRGEVAGVGVDLELARALDPRTARFFLDARERRPGELLRLWTVKEAVFKADPANDGRTLRDYELLEPGAWTGRARTPDGTRTLHATSPFHGGYLTVAVTPRTPAC